MWNIPVGFKLSHPDVDINDNVIEPDPDQDTSEISYYLVRYQCSNCGLQSIFGYERGKNATAVLRVDCDRCETIAEHRKLLKHDPKKEE